MSLLNLLEEFVMFEKIRKMKNKKGFTLVELIVVLVILAILAALLVPALTGYITKANKEKVTAECRMAVMAIQTEATTIYARDGKVTSSALTSDSSAIASLAEVKGKWAAVVAEDGTVKSVTYANGGWEVTYSNDLSGKGAGYTDPTSTVTVSSTTYANS